MWTFFWLQSFFPALKIFCISVHSYMYLYGWSAINNKANNVWVFVASPQLYLCGTGGAGGVYTCCSYQKHQHCHHNGDDDNNHWKTICIKQTDLCCIGWGSLYSYCWLARSIDMIITSTSSSSRGGGCITVSGSCCASWEQWIYGHGNIWGHSSRGLKLTEMYFDV